MKLHASRDERDLDDAALLFNRFDYTTAQEYIDLLTATYPTGQLLPRHRYIADNPAYARAQFIDALERDSADRALTDATRQAADAVRGLVDNSPVKLVRTEIAALEQRAEYAEASDALDELRAREWAEREQAVEANDAATQQLVRAEVAEPLIAQAHAALTDWQNADTAEQTARDRLPATGCTRQGGSRSAAPTPNTTPPRRPSPTTPNGD